MFVGIFNYYFVKMMEKFYLIIFSSVFLYLLLTGMNIILFFETIEAPGPNIGCIHKVTIFMFNEMADRIL